MEKKREIKVVVLSGCDDHTTMVMELDSKEVKLLEKIAKLSEKTSTYDCMPTMAVYTPDKNQSDYHLDDKTRKTFKELLSKV